MGREIAGEQRTVMVFLQEDFGTGREGCDAVEFQGALVLEFSQRTWASSLRVK